MHLQLWVRIFIPLYEDTEQLASEWTLLIEDELATAFGGSGKSGDADLILKAVNHLVGLTGDAIILQQRASVLAEHRFMGH
jgi:hypothetical protein